MDILYTIIIGFIVGLVARMLKPGDDKLGFILTTVLGVAGALVSTYAGQALGWYQAGQKAGFIGATVGAIVLLLVYGLIKGKGTTRT
jgi:uncharacterized membrane protein YeaQ/YmgE (transglycosylase-associated protein family)